MGDCGGTDVHGELRCWQVALITCDISQVLDDLARRCKCLWRGSRSSPGISWERHSQRNGIASWGIRTIEWMGPVPKSMVKLVETHLIFTGIWSTEAGEICHCARSTMSKWTICWILTTKMAKAEGSFWNFNSYSAWLGTKETYDLKSREWHAAKQLQKSDSEWVQVWRINRHLNYFKWEIAHADAHINHRNHKEHSMSHMIFNRPPQDSQIHWFTAQLTGNNLNVRDGGIVTGLNWIRCMKPDEMLDAGPEVIGVIESLVATL